MSKEAALLEVERFKQKPPLADYFIAKRSAEECDPAEFQTVLTRELKAAAPDLKIILIFVEDRPTSQLLAISPDEALLNRIAGALCDALEIKTGAGGLVCKNGRFQAKFTNAKNIKKCDQVVKDALLPQ